MTDDFGNVSGLPPELGIDSDLDKGTQTLAVDVDTRRYGKAVTVVSGFDLGRDELREVASTLKRRLACGGTVEGDAIELQGDHAARVPGLLGELGFAVA